MKIVVDLNHPADVHVFKNYINVMEKKGHNILVTASKKDVSYELLDNLEIEYEKIGQYGKSLPSKLLSIPSLDYKSLKIIKKFDPDLLLGFGSIRNAHVSHVLGKKCVNIDDTEHAVWEHRLYLPFTDVVLTPDSFKLDFGKKQKRFNGYKELAYLHPNYFTPDSSVLDLMGLSEEDRIIIVRLVSWEAGHDYGQRGIGEVVDLVKALSEYGRVYISSEGDAPKILDKYRLNIPPHKIHDLIYYSTLYLGEGATMASEASVLGTHAIYINTLALGYLEDQERRYGSVFNFNGKQDLESIKEKAVELLDMDELRSLGKGKREQILQSKIDLTEYLVSFSERFIKENSD